MRYVYRASFARFTVMSRTVAGKCKWCGNSNRFKRVYEYEIQNDGGRTDVIPGHFCSASCCKSYHNLNDRWGEL